MSSLILGGKGKGPRITSWEKFANCRVRSGLNANMCQICGIGNPSVRFPAIISPTLPIASEAFYDPASAAKSAGKIGSG